MLHGLKDRTQRSGQAGVTLIELTIVLGLFGFLVAGVLAVINTHMEGENLRTAERQIAQIAQNMRVALTESSGVVGVRSALTPAADRLQVFPLEMRRTPSTSGGYIDHVWNQPATGTGLGSVQVYSSNCSTASGNADQDNTTPLPCFGVDFSNLPASACVALAVANSTVGAGLKQVFINSLLAGDDATPAKPLPVTASVASADCNLASNTVSWIYRLKDNSR